ncbi:hypothetical protein ACG7TL_004327 [Trametes sanguinea]
MIRDWRDSSWTGLGSVQNGLRKDVQAQRMSLFGPNLIDIEGKSTLSLLIDEVIHPFYVFQIASIILWSLDDYYYYAFCIALISAISIVTTLVETKQTIKRMREMSRFVCKVRVYRDSTWIECDSSELVPGDIVDLIEPPLATLPADMFLLSGDAIVNESMLTGESVPVSKIPIKGDDLAKWKNCTDAVGDMAKSFLYAGTRVVRIRGASTLDGSAGSPALGLVVRTGFYTTKGALVRSMLFPKPTGFKFYRDSMRFIGVLAGVAGLGFCASAFQFVRLGVRWHTILLRALDLITVVVPPALPATLSIGTSFAIGRLRKLGIFCISPSRVNVAGQINVCCFDKTGTLTEDGLDILGVRAPERNTARFGELIEDIHDLPAPAAGKEKANFLYALATCHSLKKVDGEVIGDPLDVKMFEFTKWTLEEGHVAGAGVVKNKAVGDRPAALVQTVVRPPGSAQFRIEDALKGAGKHAHFLELGVIRTFEFVSALRRMSVIVKRLKSSSMEIYVKGAPEVMADICDKSTFPSDYDDLLSYYTKRGYRVIAMAGKSIEGLTWLKAQKMKREQAESNLQFLGLVIFENKLKPGTTPAIQTLRAAHFACRMITGDNPLTAVSVARECGLINPAAQVFAPTFMIGNASSPLSKLEWSSMDEPTWKLDDYSLKPLPPPANRSMETEEFESQDYTLAVTGDVFRWIMNHAPLETMQRMLVKTQIYARMSPDEKNEVVERLQALGYIVLMCGDGANDCAALKAADVGLSLSEAEASVAAPFTSRTPDISCVLEVIKEGRAALVTSFSCFKYMALYSLIQFTTITLLYSFASSLGDFQFLYIDLFIIIPIAVTMGRTLPYPRIHPKRPTASLVSKKVLASLIGQIIITSAIQFWAFFWVRSQEWYIPPVPKDPSTDDGKLESTNYENSALFLVSCFQYILVAAVFSIGPPYRKHMWTNGWFMVSMVCLSVFNLVVLLSPPGAIAKILELMALPLSARGTLLLAVVMNVLASMAFEQWGTQVVARVIGLFFELRRHHRVRDGKLYKAVEGGMRGKGESVAAATRLDRREDSDIEAKRARQQRESASFTFSSRHRIVDSSGFVCCCSALGAIPFLFSSTFVAVARRVHPTEPASAASCLTFCPALSRLYLLVYRSLSIMLGLSKSATLALLFLSLGVAHAVPLASQKRTVDTSLRLARDGDNLSQSTTVQTTNTIQTAVGPMLQTCTITLDPITGDNGEPLVRETKSCTVQMTSSGNNASGSSSSGSSDSGSSSDSASATASSSATDSTSAATDTAASASATQTDSAASATATDSNASAPASTGAIGVNIPGSALSTGATDTAAATATGASDSSQATATASAAPGGGAVSAAGFSTIDASAVATETNAAASASATPAPSGTGTAAGDLASGAASSATSAADTAQSSAASFQLPGTHLSVLPIGLGVFAGISVIALIVVGLVTYERTKYRKRKLAESGAAMGYGGMA